MDDLIPHLPLLSQIASTLVMIALAFGIRFRFQPRRHVPIMIACMICDLLNVLVIELNRGAIQKAIDTASRGGELILKFHIFASVLTIICYFVALYSGLSLLKGKQAKRRLHRANAALFLITRVLNYITSFWV